MEREGNALQGFGKETILSRRILAEQHVVEQTTLSERDTGRSTGYEPFVRDRHRLRRREFLFLGRTCSVVPILQGSYLKDR